VRFKFFSISIKNRPAKIRRPVFLVLMVGIFLAFFLSPQAGIVQANTFFEISTGTITPENQITLPNSGEPLILQPGNYARLVSPLNIKLVTKPGEDGMIRIELIGQDNRLIFRKLLDYRAYMGKALLIEQDIPFEVREDESARLQIVLDDAKGRITFLNSIDLTLLEVRGRESNGDAPVNPHFRIDKPDLQSEVTGNTVSLNCGFKPVNNTPVVVDLIAKDGHTISSRIVSITMPADQTAFVNLHADLPYRVSIPTIVTLRIRQESNSLIKGTVLLWSNKITISP
jgi:hypothetical protein